MYATNDDYSDRKVEILRNFKASTPGVLGCALSSVDGYTITSEIASSLKDERVAALAAALNWVGQQTAQDLVQGPLVRVYVEGEYGDVIVTGAGPDTLLSAIVEKDTKFGLLCFQMQRAAKELTEIAMHQRIASLEPIPQNATESCTQTMGSEPDPVMAREMAVATS
jgi:predicted regulator of Ras-like GTPase activity (Roadblock/LC7/MglB family)